MKELIHLRKPREKRILKEDGTIDICLYPYDIHYLKDGYYKEINNTMIETEDSFFNQENPFSITLFKKEQNLLKIQKNENQIDISLPNKKEDTKVFLENNVVTYQNILNEIDIQYLFHSGKLKDMIILKNKNADISSYILKIDSNLKLSIKDNTILFQKKNEIIFQIEKPTLTDSLNQSYEIYYKLEEKNGSYYLTLDFDKEILNQEELYPFVIDPTISTSESKAVYDTYIYEGDTNVDRNNTDQLIVGVDSNHRVYRTLLKFGLPIIGTGLEVIHARAILISHPSYVHEGLKVKNAMVYVHEMKVPWKEETANWESLHDAYDKTVEDFCYPSESVANGNTITLHPTEIDITNLVKRWYAGKVNNGIMLKFAEEVYNPDIEECIFYSKNNHVTTIDDPHPFLVLTIRNHSGLENYMTYQTIHHNNTTSYINHLTGNLTTVFDINQTIGGKKPIELSLIYDTNNVVLSQENGVSSSWKWNYEQTIHTLETNNLEYLCYKDGDGTNHYLYKDEDKYLDEEGLNLIATKEEDQFIITDKLENKMIFSYHEGEYRLMEIYDSSQNKTQICYQFGRIIDIYDANNQWIHITYNNNDIIVSSEYKTVKIMLAGDIIKQIIDKSNLEGYKEQTILSYNDKQLINKIESTGYPTITFDYYDMHPYRIKKIHELSKNKQIGNTLEFEYGFLETKIKNQDQRVVSYHFNEIGNTVGITYITSDNDLDNSFGLHQEYDEKVTKNKLLSYSEPSKYTNNLFSNHSFEDVTPTKYDKGIVVSQHARSGSQCLKITEETKLALPNISKTNLYTFSGYFKNSELMKIVIVDENREEISKIKTISSQEDYVRWSITELLTENRNYFVKITPASNGVIYLDDVQFEEGSVANPLNIIENSDFSKEWISWSGMNLSSYNRFVDLENGTKAFQMLGAPNHTETITQTKKYSGKKNDTYKLSFWYKNEGVRKINEENKRQGGEVLLFFQYTKALPEGESAWNYQMVNCHSSDWQYFEAYWTAKEDYSELFLSISSIFDVNSFTFTNITLTKDIGNTSFTYDEKGNLISTKDQSNEISKFQYDKNNRLISMFAPKGNHFEFEYDNTFKDRVLQGISTKGISNSIEYDENQNPIKTQIKNKNYNLDKYFAIRLKGTNKYWTVDFLNKTVNLKEPKCHIDVFEREHFMDEYDTIKTTLIPFFLNWNYEEEKMMLTDKPGSSYEFKKNKNGSYSFYSSMFGLCLTAKDDSFSIQEYDEDNPMQQWYLENMEYNSYIETRAEYTSDGRFLSKTMDSLGKTTIYDIDTITGLTKSITDANHQTTNYEYDDYERITKVEKDNKEVSYQYNENGLLSDIVCNNKNYSFTYDEFYNAKEVKINNQTLVTNTYEEKNGGLKNSIYGNGSKVEYTYDELDRLKTLTKKNKTYHYHYDNSSNIAKIDSENEEYFYYYDLAKRLSRYEYNGNTIDYEYDKNSNVMKKIYHYEDQTNPIIYTYDEDDTIIKIEFQNDTQNCIYDELGRLKKKDINHQLLVEYEYYRNGLQTSLILKSMKLGNDIYEYIYDDLYNITEIYKNNELIYAYTYDNLNELIKEDNKIQNRIYKYHYDESGNILKKQEYNLETNILIKEDNYEYENENWKDQLTKVNGTSITYDEIGNPTKIGDSNLIWNGRELQSYQDNNLSINYKYNVDGIRTEKTVNNEITKYFVENSKIIFEEKSNNVLYYMRDENNNLVGLTYNNETYYYKKNIQEDIIGIYNSMYEQIVEYEYDAWGKVLSVKDAKGQEITAKNHIAHINPFRYRSYYYDEETKLYYLNSRYYNPEWGRFINIDNYIGYVKDYLSCNLYLYSNNNYINMIDESGELFKKIWNGIKTAAQKVVEVTKSVVSFVTETSNKVVKSVTTVANVIKQSFVFEVGIGLGVGIETSIIGNEGKISFNKTMNLGIASEQIYTSTTTHFGADVKSISSTKYGLSYDVTHYDDGNIRHNNPMVMPWEVYGCPNTENTSVFFRDNVEQSRYGNFIGLSLDLYLIVGGHIKIGFNF